MLQLELRDMHRKRVLFAARNDLGWLVRETNDGNSINVDGVMTDPAMSRKVCDFINHDTTGSFFLEDTILLLQRDFSVTAIDVLTATVHKDKLLRVQLIAILTLAIAGEDTFTESDLTDLYSHANPAIRNWPVEVRPIP